MSESETSTNDQTEAPKFYLFIGWTFLWLIFCFIAWLPLSPILAAPAVWLTEIILTYAMPGFVHEFALDGPTALLVTHYGELDGEIVSARLAGYRLAFPLNTRILTYSFPFYIALSFVTTGGGNLARIASGSLILYTLLVLSMISVNLKNMLVGLGPVFIDGLSISASIIGVMSQFSILMIPTLAPVLVWGWQSRNSTYLRQLMVTR
jgi:hypothetical protein